MILGHKHAVAAVAFSEDGNVVASYSISDCLVKLWKQAPSFFGLLGSNTSCYRSLQVSPLRSNFGDL